ncbi:dihydroorotase family protein [Streptomyces sp. NPDC001663]|uniref:dihydroorotase n=1 Tax=Streptomyces sp. NPDC001663 TaxID=3364597 RepID=UPI0036A05164
MTPHGPALVDLGAHEGLTAVVAAPGALPPAARTIDATGKVVLPGGVDPHIHTNAPPGISGVLGRDVITKAALHGGTTSIIDFVWPGAESPTAVLERTVADWDGTSYTDYGFHVVLSDALSRDHLGELPAIIGAGFPSLKVFTTNITPHADHFRMRTGLLADVLELSARHGAIVDIHAEDDELVMHKYREYFESGKTDIVHMPEVHSVISEDLSFHHVMRLASHTPGSAIYMHHVTSAFGVQAIEEFRAKGIPVYGETLAVLTLADQRVYAEPDGHRYHIYPSLKYESDVDAIWEGIRTGSIHTFGTDGVCCLWEEKDRSRTIDQTFGGVTGVEPKFPLLYTAFTDERGLGLKRLAELTSENAAKIFGLYPRKGAIVVGSDADWTVIDPNLEKPVRAADLHEGDYSPWEGRVVRGWPVLTVMGGRVVVEEGVLKDTVMHGCLLRRTLDPRVHDGTITG